MLPVTALADYIYCPRKLFLNKVLELTEPPKLVLVMGAVKHEVLDLVNKTEEGIVARLVKENTLAEIEAVYKKSYYNILIGSLQAKKFMFKKLNFDPLQAFREAWPFLHQEAQARAQNLFSFLKEKNIEGQELWEALTPKLFTELPVGSERLGLRGIVDRVEAYPDQWVPIELKSGKAPVDGMWPGHRVQIAAYMVLLRDLQKNVNEGAVHYLESNQLRKLVMNPFIEEEVKGIIKKVEGVLSGTEPPNICSDRKKCVACGLRKECFSL